MLGLSGASHVGISAHITQHSHSHSHAFYSVVQIRAQQNNYVTLPFLQLLHSLEESFGYSQLLDFY